MVSEAKRRIPATMVLLLVISCGIGIWIFSLDVAVRAWVVEHPDPLLLKIGYWLGKYGDWPELMLLGAVAWLVAWKLRSQRWKKIFLAMMIASTLAGLVVSTIRLTSGRTRPSATQAPQGFYGLRHEGKWTVGRHQFNSFPSGHTATAFGFFGLLLFAAPRVGLLLLPVPVAICLSRIVTSSHHPSDVWWATMIAIFAAWLVWQKMGEWRFTGALLSVRE